MTGPIIRTALSIAAVATVLTLGACGRSMDKASMDKAMDEFQASQDAAAAQTIKAGQDFLTRTAREPGVVSLPSGLMYKVVSSPNPGAAKPSPNAKVKINYEGKLVSGQVFDSSYDRGAPAEFPLAGLVPAWQTALPMMHKGDTWMLYVPASLGYGSADMGPIPPNSVLVFKIELVDFQN